MVYLSVSSPLVSPPSPDPPIFYALKLISKTIALGVGQFLTHAIALQWIFAFTIMALLFLFSVIVAFPDATGFTFRRGAVVDADRERAPLLANENV